MIVQKRNLLKKFYYFVNNHKRMYSSEFNDVLFETRNKCGIITLNKEKALNAINLPMVQHILKHLEIWENTMSMVIIRGLGRAFCAGGDIKGAIAGGPQNTGGGKNFFLTEYKMNYKIGTYKLPYIALIDGITMGGGVGLSVHGKYRVATERTLFSMPETAIGLFPDVGASHFLTRLPGSMGMFLALTGHRLVGHDCHKIGVATHFCDSKNIPNLFDELVNSGGDVSVIENTLKKFSSDTSDKKFSLEDKVEFINNVFSLPTVEDIMAALKENKSEWSQQLYSTISKMSPTSLKISHQELVQGTSLNLAECLRMENRLAGATLEARISHDFYEGVRALLIDKDKNPKWNPAKLEDITEAMVQSCFSPLSPNEEFTI